MTRSANIRWITFILFLALIVRLAALVARHEYVPPQSVGAEAGVMASSLVQGHGFLSPFPGIHSPSTHLPPLYPMLLAALLKLQTNVLPERAAAPVPGAFVFYVALAINIAASILLPWLAWLFCRAAHFPEAVSRLTALLLCICPEAMRAVGLIWDEALFVTSVAALLLLLLRDAQRPFRWLLPLRSGVAAGLLSLLNPAFLPSAVVAWLALNFRSFDQTSPFQHTRRTLAALLLFMASAFVIQLPWHLRNWVALDPPAPVFIRGNFWLEVWTNLNPLMTIRTPDGPRLMPVHPWQGTDPATQSASLTEQQYFALCRSRALASPEFQQPRAFLTYVGRNIDAFWLGLAEAQRWQRNPLLFFFAQGFPALVGLLGIFLARRQISAPVFRMVVALLVVFPLPYYLTGGAARYRHPLDILLYVGIAWFLKSLAYKRKSAP